MQRIILSLSLITVVIGALGYGATNAFFNDTEAATANLFAAGAIDLLVDNDSYYNGVFNEDTSWGSPDPVNLDEDTFLFFDFDDVKPNDYGEDTISLHVETNDAYLCANVTLTSNDENGCTEPEGLPEGTDVTCGDPGEDEGELAGLVNFIWWADDGDNVLETDETVINQGNFAGLGVGNSYALALADSDENIWTGVGGPVPGQETQYVGKAWCFGEISEAALAPDDYLSPAEDNDGNQTPGEPEDGGFSCDGAGLGNESQTDSLTADISFTAVQARHNEGFQCDSGLDTTLTLVKELFSPVDDPTDWVLSATGPDSFSGVSGSNDVTNVVVTPGDYDLSESNFGNYSASLWNCDGGVVDGEGDTVTIAEGQQVTCTVINYIACEDASLQYADEVVSSEQGVRFDGGAINADRSDPLEVLGAPESDGSEYDSPVVAGSFFSLGFNQDKNINFDGGKIVIEFVDNFLIDGPGNDLRMWEVTGGTSYPLEKLKIEVSQTGLPGSWFEVESSVDRDAEADLANSGLAWARYVRLTDVSDRNDFTTRPTADGYDLDAFSALTCADRSYVTNPPVGITTITIDKNVSGGDAAAADFSFEIDGVAAVLGSNVATAGAHVVTEVDGPANYTPTFSGDCDENGNITAIADQNVTCSITNTYDPPVQGPEPILTENFGTGECLKDIPGWEEDNGESCINGTVAKDPDPDPNDDDGVSPDGGRFALLSGNNGYVCRSVDATGYQDVVLKYYWRGDASANDGETGSVSYFTTGTCAAPGPLTVLASHELDDGDNGLVEPWSSLQSINLPNTLNNSTFFIRFAADSNSGSESFRIDGVDITATPI